MQINCSHCQKSEVRIVINGKPLITDNNTERLVPYCLCHDCSEHLRAANYKAYNNVLNDEMEKRKKDFWQQVDKNLLTCKA